MRTEPELVIVSVEDAPLPNGFRDLVEDRDWLAAWEPPFEAHLDRIAEAIGPVAAPVDAAERSGEHLEEISRRDPPSRSPGFFSAENYRRRLRQQAKVDKARDRYRRRWRGVPFNPCTFIRRVRPFHFPSIFAGCKSNDGAFGGASDRAAERSRRDSCAPRLSR